MNDPFASAPEDEAQAEAPEEVYEEVPNTWVREQQPAKKAAPKKAVGEVTVDVKPNFVGFEPIDSSQQTRITFKSGTGFEVPWITVDFPSIDAAHEKLSDLDRQKRLVEIFDIVGRAAVKFQEKVSEHSGGKPAQGGQRPQRQQAPQGALEPPAWFPPPPAEGWVYKTGKKKNGSGVWHAWAPPQKGGGDWQFHNPPQ